VEDGNGEGHPKDDPEGAVAVDALVQPHPDLPSPERAGQADEEQPEDGAEMPSQQIVASLLHHKVCHPTPTPPPRFLIFLTQMNKSSSCEQLEHFIPTALYLGVGLTTNKLHPRFFSHSWVVIY
jgi:hypothetical protein